MLIAQEQFKSRHPFAVAPLMVLGLVLAGCGGAEQTAGSASSAETTATAPAAEAASDQHAAHGGAGTARVFFVRPQEGATVKSPVQFEFGAEQLTIAAVPQGTVTEVRPGTGHHHLGVDTDCLPAGEVIPKAAPWIHFGDGKSVIEMQLTPGPHKLALQIGDDEHRTIEGLCQTIMITVAE